MSRTTSRSAPHNIRRRLTIKKFNQQDFDNKRLTKGKESIIMTIGHYMTIGHL